MIYLTFNWDGTAVRHEMLDGQDHLVVPMVMITEGVHNGSDGPGYYEAAELAKTPQLWNHKPVVVYHPTHNGQGVTASDPVIINSRQIGIILNTKYVDDNSKPRLAAEAWLNIAKTQTVDGRILNKLEAKQKVEVSTGLQLLGKVQQAGIWKDEQYTFLARGHAPDHLAVLPDKIGACSIPDGAGLLQNASQLQQPERNRLIFQKSLVANLQGSGIITGNEMSFSDISCALCDLLATEYGEPGQYWGGYIVDVYSNYIIFRADTPDYELYQIGYSASDKGVKLTGKAVEVERAITYEVVGNGQMFARNSNPTSLATLSLTEKRPMAFDKTAHVNKLIANGAFPETDREWLAGLRQEQLERMTPLTEKVTNPPVAAAVPAVVPAVANVAAPAPALSPEEIIKLLPAEHQAVLNDAVVTMNAEKAALIDKITKAPGNRFEPAWLQAQPINNLRGMGAIIDAAKPAPVQNVLGASLLPPNYSGNGIIPQQIVANNAPVTETPLITPTINWAPTPAAASK